MSDPELEPPRPPPHGPTLPDKVAAQLRREILTGARGPNTKLPTEAALASELGVTKATVRSALHQLLATKLIRVRQGSGYFVRPFVHDAGPELLPELATLASEEGHLPAVAAELLRVRRHLASALLERLVEVQPDLGPAELAVQSMAEVVSRTDDVQVVAREDTTVVHTLLSLSGSTVLQLCFNPIRQVLVASPRLCAAMYADPASNVVGWETLLAWLSTAGAGADPAPLLAVLEARDQATLARLEAP